MWALSIKCAGLPWKPGGAWSGSGGAVVCGTVWCWWRGGSLQYFRGGGGETVDDALHADVGLLEFVGDRAEERLEVGGVVSDGCCSCFVSPVRVVD